jgi:hypothetical protein
MCSPSQAADAVPVPELLLAAAGEHEESVGMNVRARSVSHAPLP